MKKYRIVKHNNWFYAEEQHTLFGKFFPQWKPVNNTHTCDSAEMAEKKLALELERQKHIIIKYL